MASQNIDHIFWEAAQIASREEREAYLQTACGDDLELRKRVEQLLQARSKAEIVFESPLPTALNASEPPKEDLTPLLDFLAPSQRPDSLGRLGHFDVLEVIGHGGMGVVLRAFDEKLHRVAAIKVMAAQLATNAAARKRFTREAHAAAAVSDEHIVTIHAVDEANGLPYLVMHYVSGMSLQQRLDRDGPLELVDIVRIGMQTASGLAAAHAQGLIHRDIKPANILLENGVERVKITDFGLARAVADASLTQTGTVAGTPQYMSPEQARGEAVDQRSDLFSLGSVMYAMCTGRPPFRSESTIAALRRVCDDTPRAIRELNPDIPDWLVAIVNRLLAKKPEERFSTAGEVAELLGQHLAHLQHPSVARLPSPLGGEASEVRGPRRPWVLAAAALLLLLMSVGFTEATGVTHLTTTLIRIATGEGTLVVEVSDPQVQVTIEGDGGLTISGAGAQEVRVRPGSYKVQALKDGEPVPLDRELVSITRGDKQVVKVRLEANRNAAVVPQAAPRSFPRGSSADVLTSSQWEWTKAENLGPQINSKEADGGPTLSADGLTLIFHSKRTGGSGSNDLWMSTRMSLEAEWDIPVNLGATINSSFSEQDACLSADGLTLVFNSNRPERAWAFDLWMATRSRLEDAWSAPVNLGAGVNSEAYDGGPALSADGLTLVFNSDRSGASQLWQCSRESLDSPWSMPKNLGEPVNSRAYQGWAAMAGDGLALVFNSNRSGGPAAGPLWIATRAAVAESWSVPVRLLPEESETAWSPYLSADATTLLFDSKRPGGQGDFDIWMMRRVRRESPRTDSGDFVVLGAKGISDRNFDTLAEAVQQASTGDTIEVRGNGPYPTKAIAISRQALTIRAAEGFAPVIQMDPASAEDRQPLLSSNAPLVLEGLEFQRVSNGSGDTRNIITVTGGSLRIGNCRFLHLAEFGSPGVIRQQAEACVLRNCQFVCPRGVSLYVLSPPRARFVVENCVHASGSCCSFYQVTDKGKIHGGLSHNSSVTTHHAVFAHLGHVPWDSDPSEKPYQVTSSESVFSASRILDAYQGSTLIGRIKGRTTAEIEAWLPTVLDWRDQLNAYDRGGMSVTWHGEPGFIPVPKVDRSPAEWSGYWGDTEGEALEGVVRFSGGDLAARLMTAPEKILPEDFRLRADSIGYRSGSDGKDLGADVDLVGPGAAYERWKKTPEYQQWLKDTGQVK